MGVVRRSLVVLAAALALPASAGAVTYAKGVDVSNWNGSVDWIQVADDGYTFLFAKATEGTTFTDVTYAINRAGAKGFGLRIGAYHFAQPSGTSDATVTAGAIAQADHFVGVAQPAAGDLPPVLDLETANGLSSARLVEWTQAWLDEVAARTGVEPLIYASPNFWKTRLGDTTQFAGDGNRLWVAHWTTSPAPLVPAQDWGGQGWAFWQWTDCARVPGFVHCSDGDRANGPSATPFAIASFPTGPPAAGNAPTIVGPARAGAKLAGVPGTWSGGKPVAFSYQWLRCDASGAGCSPIPGATLESYTPTADDVGHALQLGVTAVTAGGSATASSSATVAISPAGTSLSARPAVLTAPSVSGTTTVGQTLTGAVGTWSGSPSTFAYAWRRCDASGAGCVAIPGATGPAYVLTPDDIGATLSLAVTATGKGGSGVATAATSAAVVPAPVPAAVQGPLTAAAGAAGAVVASDGRASVTWQPGAVPVGSAVSLDPADGAPAIAGTGISLSVTPPPSAPSLPWPVDVAYAAAPSGQVVGFSTDGRVWVPVNVLATAALSGGLPYGTYTDGTTLHVLTRSPGRIALFRPGRWGDPTRVSPRAPVLRRMTPLRVLRQHDGTLLVLTRLSTSSQAHLYATPLTKRTAILRSGSRLAGGTSRQALVLRSGGFPVRWRIRTKASLVRIRLSALDPWGRRGAFTLSFRVP